MGHLAGSALPLCVQVMMRADHGARLASVRPCFGYSSLASAFLAGRGEDLAPRFNRLLHFRKPGPVTSLALHLTRQRRFHAILLQQTPKAASRLVLLKEKPELSVTPGPP